MVKLQNYIDKHNLKLIDFFQKFDKDGSMSVSHEEFADGIQVRFSFLCFVFWPVYLQVPWRYPGWCQRFQKLAYWGFDSAFPKASR